MAASHPSSEDFLLRDRQAVVDTTIRLCMRADFHDWRGLRACFADSLVVHYPAVVGEIPQEMSADDFTARWRCYLSRFESTQHLLASHLVDIDGGDDVATCQAYFRTQHYLPMAGGETLWTVGGHYEFELGRIEGEWRIVEFVVTPLWTDGNERLHDLATE